MSKEVKSSIYTVLVIIQVLFGINFATSKIIVGKLDPFVWSNIRFFIAGIIMLSFCLILKRPHPKLTREFVLPLFPLSLVGMALGQGLFLFGLQKTSSINTAILTSTIPLVTMVLVVIRGQEKLTRNKLIGFIVAFLGVIFLRDIENVSFESSTFVGDGLVFLGAVCFGLYLSFGKKFLMSFDNMWVTTYMFLISAFLMFIYNIPRLELFFIPIDAELNFYLCSAYTIIGATLLTYFLNNWALKRAPSGNVALFIYLQPVLAAVIGYFFLDEVITIRMAVCSLFIIAGMFISLK